MKKLNITQHPVLIHEDEKLYSDLVKKGLSLFPHVMAIGRAYEELNIGVFDNKVFQTLAANKIGSIEKHLMDDTAANMTRLNLRSDTLRNEAMTGASELAGKLREAVMRFRSQLNDGYRNFPFELISIHADGTPHLTEQAHEELKEKYCRVYLHSQEEADLYTKIQAAANACNDLTQELQKHSFRMPVAFGRNPILSVLDDALLTQDGRLTVAPNYISWAINQRHR